MKITEIYIKIFASLNLITVFLLLSTTGCNNLVNGYSTDPVNITDPSVVPTSSFLTGIEVALIYSYESDMARLTGMWAQYFSGDDRQYMALAKFTVTSDYFDDPWNNIYTSLKNAKLLIEKATIENNKKAIGITQVIQAISIGLAADSWGDIPYSEAGNFETTTTPTFEAQAKVYAGVQSLLDTAITNLNSKAGKVGAEDFFFKGDSPSWVKVAYSAKARYYLHTKEYTKAIEAALQGIDSYDGNLMAPHGKSYKQDFNLYYSFMRYDRAGYMLANSYCPTLLDKLKTNYKGDTKTNELARLLYYYYPGGTLQIKAQSDYEPNSLCIFDDDTATDYFFGGTTSFPILTYAETQLILAESYLKQAASNTTDALAALNTLRESYRAGKAPFTKTDWLAGANKDFKDKDFLKEEITFNYETYTDDDFERGGMKNQDKVAPDEALLRGILLEKYLVMIGQIEGWTDMRRTKNYIGIPLPTGQTDFPRRFLYPQQEISTNPNTPSGGSIFDEVPSFKTAY